MNTLSTGPQLDHIGFVVRDRPAARELMLAVFGGTIIDDDPGIAGVTRIALSHGMFELNCPEENGKVMAKHLDRRGPGIHHLSWNVDDLTSFTARLDEHGIRLAEVDREGDRVVRVVPHPSMSYRVVLVLTPPEIRRPYERPVGGSRLRHVTIAVDDGPVALDRFAILLAGMARPFRRAGDVEVGGLDNELGIVSPVDAESVVARFLRDRGPGVHHVDVAVPDLDQASQAARERGATIVAGSADELFLHPANPTGTLFRLTPL